ncbi:hypothetical protein HMPREF9601_02436 [Cutibacterium acnes HL030PA1]|nr:hypothetical protein HMPREF9601_02436 [Cutibacterium acnes HL030PA1]EGE95049.1 hypothetical protein HMPREF9571_00878 [Cutibacterium acnes HL043PA2]EGE95123.1 hypothetical protein HMPREF9570_00026 [Cutibacterium acnes HL043PA1]
MCGSRKSSSSHHVHSRRRHRPTARGFPRQAHSGLNGTCGQLQPINTSTATNLSCTMAVSAASARPAASDMEGVAPLDAPRPFFRAPESQAKSVNSIG